MDEIVSYLRRVPAWYLATIDVNDPTQPRVRPFSFAMADAGKLWFCTSRDKDVRSSPQVRALRLETG